MVSKAASKAGLPYSATLLSSVAAIKSLADKAKPLLLERHSTSYPDFFLASVSKKQWKPCAVAVTYNNHIVGIVYAKERLLFGRPTGIVYADTALGMNVVAEGAHREEVLRLAIGSFLTLDKVRGLRLVVPVDGFDKEILFGINGLMDVDLDFHRLDNHSCLSLPSDHGDFLKRLGAHLRSLASYQTRIIRSSSRTTPETSHSRSGAACGPSEQKKKGTEYGYPEPAD